MTDGAGTVADKGKHAAKAQDNTIRGNALQRQKRCQLKNTHENPKQIQQRQRSMLQMKRVLQHTYVKSNGDANTQTIQSVKHTNSKNKYYREVLYFQKTQWKHVSPNGNVLGFLFCLSLLATVDRKKEGRFCYIKLYWWNIGPFGPQTIWDVMKKKTVVGGLKVTSNCSCQCSGVNVNEWINDI